VSRARRDCVTPSRKAPVRQERRASSPRDRVYVPHDFSRFETSAGGSWNISGVIDYATKVCIAAPITGRQGARDAVAALTEAIEAAEELLGRPLIEDCVDPETGELEHLTIVTDNGPAYKSDAFMRFFMSRPELEHVRIRAYTPGQNGVVERFYRSLKYDHLYQLEIADAIELDEQVELYRQIYNEVRPHESLGQVPPMSVYLQDPNLFQAESVQKT